MKNSQTSKFKAKSNTSTQEEWETILREIFLGTKPETQVAINEGVEAVAKVESGGESMTITIQKRVEGITV